MNDLESAKYLLGLRPYKIEIIAFHCQQSAEKALKALLIMYDIEPPRTHDLRVLLHLCEDIDTNYKEIKDSCERLTIYGTQPRYPMDIGLNESDMRRALEDADLIMEFVTEWIGHLDPDS
jgi:HEPN domain-containing protein